ncbi:LysE family translocator [Jiella pacifica]|uniref:LysE family transporter n=1 Tax=Jiella pacifica TaxID=2696469 RepID=A0A6N9TAT5_9HYPH|nr:LysE family translocator [Jiella pacifica]NDW06008.1 LysE family transporter [Jiella pacifica]
MIGFHQVLAFGFAASLLLVTPGPSVLYVTSRTLNGGALAGVRSIVGLAVGDFLQVLAVALGIAAVVAASPTALQALKLVGACYLLYLAWKCLPRPGVTAAETNAAETPRPDKSFRDAVIVNGLNPKSTLFFLAFLPSFVEPTHGPTWLQALSLGLVFVLVGIITNGAWALAAGAARSRTSLGSNAIAQHWLPAIVLMGLAALTFWQL